MALTPADLAYIREEIGVAEPPDDSDLDAIYDRVGSVTGVAAAVIRQRLADALNDGPASFSADDYSQNTSKNIEAWEKQLARLEAAPGGDPTPSNNLGVGRLVREYDR